MPNDMIVQFLAGPRDERASTFFLRLALRISAFGTMVAGPLFVLLLIQWKFLPYQDEFATWTHRAAVAVELGLLWWLWRKATKARPARSLHRRARLAGGWAATLAIGFGSVLLLTFPGERI
jgi:hypothetical protein